MDNQTAVTIVVTQGERQMAADNKILGQFNLEGIEPAPRGIPQIEVSFSIDVNGITKVTAKDKKTNKEQTITIQNTSDLSKEEVEKMVKEAEANREADQKKRREIEVTVRAEQTINQLEKVVSGEEIKKADPKQKEELEKELNSFKELLSKKSIDELKTVMPAIYDEFISSAKKLEQHYRDMQDIEFTIQNEKLFFLQTRNGKRTAKAAINVAVDLVEEGLITKEEAVMRIEPAQLDNILHPNFDEKERSPKL